MIPVGFVRREYTSPDFDTIHCEDCGQYLFIDKGRFGWGGADTPASAQCEDCGKSYTLALVPDSNGGDSGGQQ